MKQTVDNVRPFFKCQIDLFEYYALSIFSQIRDLAVFGNDDKNVPFNTLALHVHQKHLITLGLPLPMRQFSPNRREAGHCSN